MKNLTECPHETILRDVWGVTCCDCCRVTEGHGFNYTSMLCRHVRGEDGLCTYCRLKMKSNDQKA